MFGERTQCESTEVKHSCCHQSPQLFTSRPAASGEAESTAQGAMVFSPVSSTQLPSTAPVRPHLNCTSTQPPWAGPLLSPSWVAPLCPCPARWRVKGRRPMGKLTLKSHLT